MMRILLLTLAAACAAAQNLPTPPPAGSISGVIKDSGTGMPVADVVVGIQTNTRPISVGMQLGILEGRDPKRIQASTDGQGRYTLRDVPPGKYLVSARTKDFSTFTLRIATLTAGQNLTSIDFNLRARASIAGKVLDPNKEPLPGITVWLLAREYQVGVLRSFVKAVATTDDRGEYTMARAEPGRSYWLLALKRNQRLNAISDVPADPKLRKQILAPTYYPESPDMDGAVPLVLRPGERREGIDIRMKKSPSFCIEGTLELAGVPAPLRFWIQPQEISGGMGVGVGVAMLPPSGTAGPDGKIRICDLRPGLYRLTALSEPGGAGPLLGATSVNIADRDVRNVKAVALPGLTIPGEVAWDGEPAEKPIEGNVRIGVRNLGRAVGLTGEKGGFASSSIPGEFALTGLLMEDYSINVRLPSSGLYTKDVTYGGVSVLHAPFRPGTAMGDARLRVIIGRDAGTITAKVADKEGNPVGDAHVILMPAEAESEASLAETLTSFRTDQDGLASFSNVRPGKYHVMATNPLLDETPESIGKLWHARSAWAKQVDLGPNASLQITLQPVTLE